MCDGVVTDRGFGLGPSRVVVNRVGDLCGLVLIFLRVFMHTRGCIRERVVVNKGRDNV